jgi:hypothetical protein
MNYKKHKNFTVLLGSIHMASLLFNLSQIFLYNQRNFIEMFRYTKEVGLPWIPYISLGVIFLSALGAVGLMKYRQWGFYGIYFSYLAGASVAWFPFFPGFIFGFIFPSTSGIYGSIIMLIVILAVLGFLIYLHVTAKKGLYFKKMPRI